MTKNLNLLGAICFLFFAGCASTKDKDTERTPAGTEEKVVETRESLMDRQVVSSIGFSRGQGSINHKAEAEIKKAIETAKAKGDIVAVEVVVWSDQKYSKDKTALSPKQRQLTSQRGENLKALIDNGAPDAEVTVINMAERPSPLSRHFDTRTDEMKKKLTSMGFAPGPNNSFDSGRPSTALVLIRVK